MNPGREIRRERRDAPFKMPVPAPVEAPRPVVAPTPQRELVRA
jgi:hypothetical protein